VRTQPPRAHQRCYVRDIPPGVFVSLLPGQIRFAAKNWRALPQFQTIKATTRHLGASFIGHLSAMFLIPPLAQSLDQEVRRLAARIFGSWAVSVLAMDALVDDEDQPEEALESFFEQWQGLLADSPRAVKPVPADSTQAGLLASLSLSALGETLCLGRSLRAAAGACHEQELTASFTKFAAFAATLGQAEKESLHQKHPGTQYDLEWYLKRILPNKTEPFLFAPMWLCTVSPSKFEEFERIFRCMSAPYGHWQVQDDVSDFIKDTKNGITNTPGYVVMKQAELARQAQGEGSLSEADPKEIVRIAEEIGLLDPRFAGLSTRSGSAPETRGEAIRMAVCNRPAAAAQPLNALLSKAIDAGEAFRQIRAQRDPDAGLEILKSTHVLERLVPLEMPERGIWHEEGADSAVVRLVEFLETLVRRPTAKAIELRDRDNGGASR
jgi:hypothetical protein